jgi:hypothetical protein
MAARGRRVADSKIAAKRQNGMRDNQVDLSSVSEGRGMTVTTTTDSTATPVLRGRPISIEAERRMIKLHRKGLGFTAIGRQLEAEGFKPPHGGDTWATSTIYQALERVGVINPKVGVPQHVVDWARRLQNKGETLERIAVALNDRGYRSVRGGRFVVSNTRSMLQRDRHAAAASARL